MTLSDLRKRFYDHKAERLTFVRGTDAAVLIPLVEKNGEWNILFEVRQSGIPQEGEICFPGGRIEAEETAEHTARRETAEELLLAQEQVEVVAPVSWMAGHWGGDICSYLGVLHDYDGTFAPAEVARVFLLPLSWFEGHPPREAEAKMVFQGEEGFPYHLIPGGENYPFASMPRRMYFYETEYGVIWGLTASLLHHFLSILEEKAQ